MVLNEIEQNVTLSHSYYLNLKKCCNTFISLAAEHAKSLYQALEPWKNATNKFYMEPVKNMTTCKDHGKNIVCM